MPLKKDELERQLQGAVAALAEWTSVLDERDIPESQRHRDPIWRNLKAQCRQLKSRLRTTDTIISRDEEMLGKRADKMASPGKKKAAKKKAAPKKKAAAEKPKKAAPKKKAAKKAAPKKKAAKKKAPAKKKKS